MKISCNPILLALVFATGVTLPLEPALSKDLLQGRVEQSDQLNTAGTSGASGPSLSRSDLNDAGDPFGGPPEEADEVLVAPEEAFKGQSIKPPKKQFPLHAEKAGMPETFQGQPGQGVPGQGGVPFQGMPGQGVPGQNQLKGLPVSPDASMAAMPPLQESFPQMPQAPFVDPNDPDSTPEMQLAWDAWHRRVAAAVFERFNFFAKTAFKYSRPMVARVGYVVHRNGQITNVTLIQPSPNIMFNVLVTQVIKSINGDLSILQFPDGSRRMMVEKYGNFSQNLGIEGFRHVTGDRETIQQQQMFMRR